MPASVKILSFGILYFKFHKNIENFINKNTKTLFLTFPITTASWIKSNIKLFVNSMSESINRSFIHNPIIIQSRNTPGYFTTWC